jgi:hypothetical protein
MAPSSREDDTSSTESDISSREGDNHIYTPLIGEEGVIRLLTLYAGTRGSPIKCELRQRPFSWNLNYVALSYMWGQDLARHPIEVNGCEFHVRQNLLLALDHLRYESNDRTLWIDAICINQDSIHERNHQVTLMKYIYKKAKRVVVWLGSSDQSSSSTMEYLNSLWKYENKTEGEILSFFRAGILNGEVLSNLHSFCNRRYWSRLWIIQEVILATDIRIRCGDDICYWDDLAFLFRHLQPEILWRGTTTDSNHIYGEPLESGTMMNSLDPHLWFLRKLRESIPARLVREREVVQERDQIQSNMAFYTHSEGDSDVRTLLNICTDYAVADCVDERDKIFGLHAVAPDCCRRHNPIDYSLSLFEIARNLVEHHTYDHCRDQTRCIRDSQLFHKSLRLTSDYLNDQPRVPRLREVWYRWIPRAIPDQPTISVRGHFRGRIIHISPTLKNLHRRTNLRIPSLPPTGLKQLNYITSLASNAVGGAKLLNRQLDLVRSGRISDNCDGHAFEHILDRSLCSKFGWTTSGGEFWKEISAADTAESLDDSQGQPIRSMLSRLLLSAQELVAAKTAQNCRLAFEERGLVLFVPVNARVGDMVCQFPASNSILLIRPPILHNSMKNPNVPVGRGANFLHCPTTSTPHICGKSIDLQVVAPDFLLQIPSSTFYMMTCASSTPDPPKDTPKTLEEK